MKKALAVLATVVLSSGVGIRASDPVLTGDYVETRTAEVFTGPCILGSEGETSGKEAIMAWHVSRGSLNGVALDGLSVVAVIAADRHLSFHEYGAPAPSSIKSVVMTDSRATAAQQKALIDMARALAPAAVTDVIATRSVPITFKKDDDGIRVSAGAASLDVTTNFEHPMSCGAMKWFDPLSRTDAYATGLTRAQEWSGKDLGMQWRQFDRKSSYAGTFSYKP
jgi:hypothetical protein